MSHNFSLAKERARYVGLLLEPDDRDHLIRRDFFAVDKSVYSHLQDDFKSLPSLSRRTSS